MILKLNQVVIPNIADLIILSAHHLALLLLINELPVLVLIISWHFHFLLRNLRHIRNVLQLL